MRSQVVPAYRRLFLSTTLLAPLFMIAGISQAAAQVISGDTNPADLAAVDGSIDLQIGASVGGNGMLTIQNGGTLTNGTGFLGSATDSKGMAAVSGNDGSGHVSTWANTGDLVVGQSGLGTLTIEDGGRVTNNSGYIGADQTASPDPSTVRVSGRDSDGNASTWINSGQLFVGDGGTATLNISDGGFVSNGLATVGNQSTGDGMVTVSGTDGNGNASTWISSGQIYLGQQGTGMLRIEGGGMVQDGQAVLGGTTGIVSGGTGIATVSGTDGDGHASTWNVYDNIYAGFTGTGTLTIEDGGAVHTSTVGGGAASIYIGFATGSTGSVTVSSSTADISTLTATDRIEVGINGISGTLNVEEGGLVSAGSDVYIADGSASGTVNLLGSATGRGILETGSVIKGQGAAILNLDGGILRATRNEADFLKNFGTQVIAIDVNGATVDTHGHDIGIAPQLGGVGSLTKDGAGILTLTGNNIYAGNTTITAGTLQLGDGGTSGWIVGNVADDSILAFNRSDAVSFDGTILGTGGVHQIGTGMTTLTADNTGLTGVSLVQNGILSVNGRLGGSMEVRGGRLQGVGHVGDTTNFAGGMIAPGNSIGVLTVDGNYAGNGGSLEIETRLGDDSSPTDMLVVTGNTSGDTDVQVINVGGGGAQTTEGVKIVDVAGDSIGNFTLLGNYVFDGDPAVVAGAYAYRLYHGGVSTPTDGDWYLRSSLKDPTDPTDPVDPADPDTPDVPLYQPGAPLYEAYALVLQSFNSLDTLQQRVGNRSWTRGVVETGVPDAEADGIWGRIVASHISADPKSSTTDLDYDSDTWQLQAGADSQLYGGDAGRLVGGLSVRYGTISANIDSVFGSGAISSTGYGLGGTLTWYGKGGFYLDAQANLTWYDSDLSASTVKRDLVSDNDGFGYAAGLEVGQHIALGPNWSITPQAQLIYSAVDYDDFTDAFGSDVSLADGDSLRGRFGVSADYQNNWTDESGDTRRVHGYGIANFYYDFSSKTAVDLAGVRLHNAADPLWGGLGIGGTYNWGDDKYALHGEAGFNTSLSHFGKSYDLTGTAGISIKF